MNNNKKITFLFAHGAGADSQSAFIQQISSLVTNEDIEVVTFDFPYMQRRQLTQKKSPPDRMHTLLACFKEHIATSSNEYLFIGGKSMGSRVASMLADDEKVNGLICLGYPFHPPGKPEKLRVQHLQHIKTPSLIIQGERDIFGRPEEVKSYDLSNKIHIQWMDDANHSLETLKRSPMTTDQSWQKAALYIQDFIYKQVAINRE